MRNRGIGRARIFMGTALLLAAALTWGIGLMMSPHGETVAKGTEYLRSTVITFKRNGAIGTLILCALAAWLLFPSRRPKRPFRDWSLVIALVLLSLSSLYTLISFGPFQRSTANSNEDFAISNMNDLNESSARPEASPGTDMNAPPEADRIVSRRAVVSLRAGRESQMPLDNEIRSEGSSISVSGNDMTIDSDSERNSDDPSSNEADQDQE